MKKSLIASIACMIGLGGCGSTMVEAYRNEKPVLDLAQYFNGTIDGWGVFQDRSGKVVKRFYVKIDAGWQGNTGTLDEDFSYADGSTSRRVWTITKLDAHTYEGRADDVVGVATGTAYGNALRWTYVLRLPVDGKVYDVDFDDWMYLMDDKVMLNRSVMSKFGFRLGDLTLSFARRSP
ncbi:MAG: DUF3833 domain-containing protein [Burkholderiales bacterium]|nr:DUF3833 domain-containing protein [Burkholderiales bacterium]